MLLNVYYFPQSIHASVANSHQETISCIVFYSSHLDLSTASTHKQISARYQWSVKSYDEISEQGIDPNGKCRLHATGSRSVIMAVMEVLAIMAIMASYCPSTDTPGTTLTFFASLTFLSSQTQHVIQQLDLLSIHRDPSLRVSSCSSCSSRLLVSPFLRFFHSFIQQPAKSRQRFSFLIPPPRGSISSGVISRLRLY